MTRKYWLRPGRAVRLNAHNFQQKAAPCMRAFSVIILGVGLTTSLSLAAQDVDRGKTIFEGTKGNCVSCHRVNGSGSLFGPDLSAIGAPPRQPAGGGGRGGQAAPPPAAPTAQQFSQKLLDPNASVSVFNRYVRLTMKDGKIVTGKLLNVDTFAVQIFDSSEKLVNVSKTNLRDMTMVSPMPSYRDKLNSQELADVVGYLMSLKGQ
jgi:mono/diheme cytochrome c family protein